MPYYNKKPKNEERKSVIKSESRAKIAQGFIRAASVSR